MPNGFTGIIDISHHQSTPTRAALAEAGIAAVIHKATQGASYRDSHYTSRKTLIKESWGLKWGSYHYVSGSSPIGQVENYLNYAQPAPDELICIDYEASTSGPNMTLAQLEDMVQLLKDELGRYPMIYGGALLREVLQGVGKSVLKNCPLWYSRYNASPIGVPALWSSWTLWQYTDGNVGPEPKSVPAYQSCDHSAFAGTREELLAAWPFA